MEVVGQRFIFDESGAVYICIARYNEYANFRIKISLFFIHFTYKYLTLYTLQLTCVLFRNRPFRPFAFVYYGADCENRTALRSPRPLTRIDLLYSYRTGPGKIRYLIHYHDSSFAEIWDRIMREE